MENEPNWKTLLEEKVENDAPWSALFQDMEKKKPELFKRYSGDNSEDASIFKDVYQYLETASAALERSQVNEMWERFYKKKMAEDAIWTHLMKQMDKINPELLNRVINKQKGQDNTCFKEMSLCLQAAAKNINTTEVQEAFESFFHSKTTGDSTWRLLLRRMEHFDPELYRRVNSKDAPPCYEEVCRRLLTDIETLRKNLTQRNSCIKKYIDLGSTAEMTECVGMDHRWIVLAFTSGTVKFFNRWTLELEKTITLALPPEDPEADKDDRRHDSSAKFQMAWNEEVFCATTATSVLCYDVKSSELIQEVQAPIVEGKQWKMVQILLGRDSLLVATFAVLKKQSARSRMSSDTVNKLIVYCRNADGQFVQQREIDLQEQKQHINSVHLDGDLLVLHFCPQREDRWPGMGGSDSEEEEEGADGEKDSEADDAKDGEGQTEKEGEKSEKVKPENEERQTESEDVQTEKGISEKEEAQAEKNGGVTETKDVPTEKVEDAVAGKEDQQKEGAVAVEPTIAESDQVDPKEEEVVADEPAVVEPIQVDPKEPVADEAAVVASNEGNEPVPEGGEAVVDGPQEVEAEESESDDEDSGDDDAEECGEMDPFNHHLAVQRERVEELLETVQVISVTDFEVVRDIKVADSYHHDSVMSDGWFFRRGGQSYLAHNVRTGETREVSVEEQSYDYLLKSLSSNFLAFETKHPDFEVHVLEHLSDFSQVWDLNKHELVDPKVIILWTDLSAVDDLFFVHVEPSDNLVTNHRLVVRDFGVVEPVGPAA